MGNLENHPKITPRRKSSGAPAKDRDVIAAVERELRQIGDDLHDNLCQTLAGTSMVIETIGRAVVSQEPVSPQALAILRKILETAIAQTRGLSHRFNPPKLGGAGLMAAFQRLAEESPNCEFICEKPLFIKNSNVALALLRIAQEAVKNSIQHSGARRIHITLKRTREEVTLRIKDNGSGFKPAAHNGEITGLSMMHRRAKAVGGCLRTVSLKDYGTVISCKLPLDGRSA